MGKFTDGGWVPADDPMFNGQVMIFSVNKCYLDEGRGDPDFQRRADVAARENQRLEDGYYDDLADQRADEARERE